MDFSAWFEVYLGGAWHTFDARHNHPRIGRVLMARGRDAADVAISTTFGPNTLSGFKVVTEEIAWASVSDRPLRPETASLTGSYGDMRSGLALTRSPARRSYSRARCSRFRRIVSVVAAAAKPRSRDASRR
jgi:transglutaminase-like putative cysteine protease